MKIIVSWWQSHWTLWIGYHLWARVGLKHEKGQHKITSLPFITSNLKVELFWFLNRVGCNSLFLRHWLGHDFGYNICKYMIILKRMTTYKSSSNLTLRSLQVQQFELYFKTFTRSISLTNLTHNLSSTSIYLSFLNG